VVTPYTGADWLDRFAAESRGAIAVIAGNNARKAEYISRAVGAGCHTLADKPMVIAAGDYPALVAAFDEARAQGVLVWDIMTERHEIASILQKELAAIPALFGARVAGTRDEPAISKESVHHFAKLVSGAPIVRPAWFFDTAQQGEGLVDITTHLVDLVQWACFPETALAPGDVRVLHAKRWPTVLTPAQFTRVTGVAAFPPFLRKDVAADGNLHVYANGEIDYTVRGLHAKVSVLWNYEAPPGAGDTHHSVLRGAGSRLVIRQGAEQGWTPTLYVEPATDGAPIPDAATVTQAMAALQPRYPGVGATRDGDGWRVDVPAAYHVGHEAHFGQVATQFMDAVARGGLPAWEVPNLLAKYALTTQALALARGG
jgi:predicted dehydrogenase